LGGIFILKFIDVHCHISDEDFNRDRDEVIRRALNSNVIALITSSLTFNDAIRALKISSKYPGFIFVTIGNDPLEFDLSTISKIRDLIIERRYEIVGIGEVGLDYYYAREASLREKQKQLLREWISLAKELDLPLIIHSRSAGKYAIKLLLEEHAENVLMHAYDGRPGWALKATEAGYFFSIPTSVWRSAQKQKLVKFLPLDHLMLETDAPVLSPILGRRNEPVNIIYAAKKISEIKNVDLEQVAEVTTRNAIKFFSLPITIS